MYLPSVSISRTTYFSCMLSSSIHLNDLPGIFLIEAGVLLSLQPISFSIGTFLSHFPLGNVIYHSYSISFFSPITSSFIAFFKSVFGNDLC